MVFFYSRLVQKRFYSKCAHELTSTIDSGTKNIYSSNCEEFNCIALFLSPYFHFSGDNHGGHYVVYINPLGDGKVKIVLFKEIYFKKKPFCHGLSTSKLQVIWTLKLLIVIIYNYLPSCFSFLFTFQWYKFDDDVVSQVTENLC